MFQTGEGGDKLASTASLASSLYPHITFPPLNDIMEHIYTFDPLASPAPSAGADIQDDRSDDESSDIDVSRLDNVYKALMSTLLDSRLPVPQSLSMSTTDEPVKEATDAGNGGTDGAGAVKNAKRRKMDKKKAKREEQKREAEEVVDVVGECSGLCRHSWLTVVRGHRIQALLGRAR